ncbi:2'-5'-oligoadenylate synthase 1 [Patella vulgata]|uniref:2'-5'-oligoadenylate synthase 1 n=1 Tax=Patella vulgata TaxID=6465 RepID=UPI00217FC1EE|nr:2'-5'-oligoadenylate synthase 1 [Patella vulgata]XP_050391590.1 2'-5'-oligoadenylate synthase 1 [Patella vulgata]
MSSYLRGYERGESLEKFIDKTIRPPNDFKERVNHTVDQVVRYLHRMPGYSIQEVVKSGSLGKGTSILSDADADMVVFFNGYTDMESLIADKPQIIRDVRKYMCNPDPVLYRWLFPSKPEWMDSIHVLKCNEYLIKFMVYVPYKGRSESVEVDVLPAIYVVAKHGEDMQSVYREMQNKSSDVRSHYSVCFCKQQLAMIRPKQAKVKDLIRLLKYWYKTNGLTMASYCCEVMGLYIYDEHLNSKTNFKMKTGFYKAMELFSSYRQLQITIPGIYSTRNWSSYFPETTYVLDPVNPFSDTSSHDVHSIERCARDTLNWLENVPMASEGCGVLSKTGAVVVVAVTVVILLLIFGSL